MATTSKSFKVLNGISVTGSSTFSDNLTLSSTLTANGSVGTSGQVLSSTGTGLQWVTSSGSSSITLWLYSATGGETSLSGTGVDGNTLAYTAGSEMVYLNGVLLVKTQDYTATNGTSITLGSALSSGDYVEVISIAGNALITEGYAPLASPTFTGTVVLPSTTSIGTVSSTEIGYLDGVTSAIQTQIDSKLSTSTAASTYETISNVALKAPLASPTFTGTVTLPLTTAGIVTTTSGGVLSSASYQRVNADLYGYTSTATAAGTTTLTNTSSQYQFFTGTATQTVVLPVTSTLVTGWTFHIVNNSTGNLTVNSSGGNLVITVLPGTTAMVTCIGTTLTTAADWESGYTDFSTATGTGAVVLGTNPTITPAAATLTTATTGAGYMGMPQNSTTTGAYRLTIDDAGKHIYSTATRTITIPGNTTGGSPQVAFPIGSTIVFANATGTTLTLQMDSTTTDTCLLAGVGTSMTGGSGSRSLAAFGMATLLKITATSWIISGNGLT